MKDRCEKFLRLVGNAINETHVSPQEAVDSLMAMIGMIITNTGVLPHGTMVVADDKVASPNADGGSTKH
jgi:anti-sigma factor ChrR (cupin superfamily)